jgi:hypothetical protein
MKKIVKILCLLLFTAIYCNAQTHPLRWYPIKEPVPAVSKSMIGLNPNEFSTKDSTIYFGPSVAFDVFMKEKSSGSYTLGVIPGVGYGLKYNPFKWKNSYLVGLDVFAQAGLSGQNGSANTFNYFDVDIVPVITLMNWIHVGYGPRFKIGLNGVPNANTWLFTIGISKSL